MPDLKTRYDPKKVECLLWHSYQPCRHTAYHGERGYVFCHYRPGCYYGPLAHSNTRQDHRLRCDPHVVRYHHCSQVRPREAHLPAPWGDAVSHRDQLATMAYHCEVADPHAFAGDRYHVFAYRHVIANLQVVKAIHQMPVHNLTR
jgi:hypothetical protein